MLTNDCFEAWVLDEECHLCLTSSSSNRITLIIIVAISIKLAKNFQHLTRQIP